MIILTGFEKFSGFSQNISEELVKNFPDKINNYPISKKILPVSWKGCLKSYKEIIKILELNPTLVVLTGVYSGKKVLIERYGWNLIFGIDNYSRFRIGIIKIGKPIRMKTNLDVKKIVEKAAGKKSISISSFPGLYLCNYIYNYALYFAKGDYPVIFIHLPAKSNIKNISDKVSNIIRATLEIHIGKRD